LRRNPILAVGSAMIAIWILTALGASWLTAYSPTDSDFLAFLAPPSASHWFGTDQLGRDVFSRVLHGGRSVLELAPAATLLGLVLGASIGLVAGYFGGAADEMMMRTLDAVMALPVIVLAAVATTMLGSSLANLVLVIGLIFTPPVARTVRAATLGEVDKEYVQAARLRGESLAAILVLEILPNLSGPLIAEGTTRLGYAVFTSATLGFLGFGIQPPTPDWGLMVSENQAAMTIAPWPVLFPAAAIAFVVVGFGLIVDGLSEGDR
jgi:peptide/nickel transport system permease protein